MDAVAVVLDRPNSLFLHRLDLTAPTDGDVIVEVDYSGISTGTERLLYQGRMPPFPGMGYPLVPGYESVGRIADASPALRERVGETVFVPGATCFAPRDGIPIRGLFGGAASRLVVPASRVLPIGDGLGDKGVLLALAATARHAMVGGELPELIIGHGVVGRLLARLVVAAGGDPTVWETNPDRCDSDDYAVIPPDADTRHDYRCICEASGDPAILDRLVRHLGPGGEIVLAGFYAERLSFAFPMAFMKEARLRVAAQWQPADLLAVKALIADGSLSLDGLITHRMPARRACEAYRQAFEDPSCLKMVLDWRETT